ncbi:hypothetical protein Tco_0055150, partial [Tanacetum coccineum]
DVMAAKVVVTSAYGGGDGGGFGGKRGGDGVDRVDRRWMVMKEGDDGSGGGWPEFGRIR